MSTVVNKKPAGKHPDHPSRDPDRKWMEAAGRRNLKKMKFESPAAKRDYERAVGANKFNIMGNPPFYPPEVLPSMPGIGPGKKTELLPCGHRWVRARIIDLGVFYSCRHGGEWHKDVVDNPDLPARHQCPRPEPTQQKEETQ